MRPLFSIVPPLLLSVLAITMWSRAPLSRPFESDEIFCLRRFSSLPYEQNCEAVAHWKRFDVRKAAGGVAKCFLTAYDTGNHILITIPGALSTFLFGFSERAFRLPSVLEGIAACLALYCVLRHEMAPPALATAAAAIALTLPHFFHYGMTARGYSGNALLVLLQILLVQRASAKTQLFTAVALAIASLLMCMNIVTMAVVWLAPLFLVLVCLGRRGSEGVPPFPRERAYWLGAALLSGSWCGIYGICHLNDFRVVSEKLGIHFHSLSALPGLAAGLWHYLVPPLWILPLAAGAIGIVWALVRGNWLAWVIVLSLIMTLAYVSAGHNMPYYRTFGHFMLYCAIGGAWLWRAIARRARGGGAMLAGLALVLVFAIPAVIAGMQDLAHPPAPEFPAPANSIRLDIERLGETPASALILNPYDMGEQMRYYLPADPRYCEMYAGKSDSLLVYIPCESGSGAQALFTAGAVNASEQNHDPFALPPWPVARSASLPPYEWIAVPMRKAPAITASCIAVWSGFDPDYNLRAYLDRELPGRAGSTTIRFNLDDYLAIKTVTFFINSQAEADAVNGLLSVLGRQTAGRVFVLVPAAPTAQ